MPVVFTVVFFCALAAAGCSDSGGPSGCDCEPGDTELAVELVADGLSNPLYLTTPAGDSRLFVVEQVGRVRIVENGQLLGTPFLDITDRVASGGERGLLSIAFHPDYASNGYFYASYIDDGGDTRIERYSVTGDPNVADPGSVDSVRYVEQPFSNHNGGLIVFGPDGMLYIGLGDGGSGGDPGGNGQNRNTLLGALLRIDVDGGDPFAVPADNPFVGDPGGRDEIWAYGLRNPWRFSFDREAGDLYIADVGQNRWEEVNVVPADSGGANFGWNVMEGTHCFPSDPCDSSDLVPPAVEYGHGEGCSVTGGYVYRGSAIPEIRGHYFYSDFCGGFLRSFRFSGGTASERREWNVGDLGAVLSFGEDADGELYMLSGDGRLYKLVAAEQKKAALEET
jgi:glucose/arabinose dehydrogenase